jgi:hypothetical protein
VRAPIPSPTAPHTSLFILAPPSLPLRRQTLMCGVASESALVPPPSPVAPCANTQGWLCRVTSPPPDTALRVASPPAQHCPPAAALCAAPPPACRRRPTPRPSQPTDAGRRASALKVFFQVYFKCEQILMKFEIQLTKFDYVRMKLTTFDYVTLKFTKFDYVRMKST